MPLFAIIGHDVANSAEQRKLSRAAHVARLKQLEQEGRLLIAGPTPIAHKVDQTKNDQSDISEPKRDKVTEMSGSIIIADFETLESAQSWVNDEPYLKDGVYSHVDLRPFIHVLPQPKQHA